MALKMLLDADEFGALDATIAALYEKTASGYALNVEAADDDGLRRALAAERTGHRDAAKEAAAAKRQAERAAEEVTDAANRALASERAAGVLRGRILADAVDRAAAVAGLHPSAIADAQRAAREKFAVGDDGTVAAIDGGRDTLQTFFEASRTTSPHWHPAGPGGTGAPPHSPGAPSAATISRARFDQLSPAQRAAVARDGVAIRD